ncbi:MULTISPECIES: hypothetical protein [Micromonospora]|uniref:hypothetical protein n=1 Tax=Micromonospora TaxID=1873 RepID=UPI001304DD0E|nr:MULTISPECIES: hypothetical protein [Micromonospora]
MGTRSTVLTQRADLDFPAEQLTPGVNDQSAGVATQIEQDCSAASLNNGLPSRETWVNGPVLVSASTGTAGD